MPTYRRIVSTFQSLFRKAELDADLEQELQCHLELLIEEKIASGMDMEAARRAALIELGGMEQVKEAVRAGRLGAWLDQACRDVHYALRTLRRSPGFSLVALSILAIGIGATTSLFSTAHTVLLKGVPFPDPTRLVAAQKTIEKQMAGSVSRVDYFDYRELSESFDQLAAILDFTVTRFTTGDSRPVPVEIGFVTWNLFTTLGVDPLLGRGFQAEDEVLGGDTTVVVSYGFWMSRLGGTPEVIGKPLTLDGESATIVGVMPRGFLFLHDADVWHLVNRDGPFDTSRDSHSHLLIGRLRDGVTIAQAQEEVGLISRGLEQEYPDTNAGKGLELSGLPSFMVRDVRLRLLLLTATAVLVLLIACANVSGLMLARGERRRAELALRTALGASRGRLVRQLLTESAVLTLSAGMLSLGLAYLLQIALLRLLPMGVPGVNQSTFDLRAVGFALLVSMVAGLLVGVIPAFRGSTQHPARHLGSGIRLTAGAHSTRFRSALVMVQVAATASLLIGSGLLIRSLENLSRVELGFDPTRLLTGAVRVQITEDSTAAGLVEHFQSLIDSVQVLPGVQSATFTSKLPIRDKWQDWTVWRAERPRPASRESYSAMVRWVSPGHFDTMRIPIVAGRDFSRDDLLGAPYVAVLSQSTARALFEDENPLGRQVKIGWDDREFRVIGIAADARLNVLQGAPDGAAYMSTTQQPFAQLRIAVRTTGEPGPLVGAIDGLLERNAPDTLLSEPATMASVVDAELAGLRTITISLILFTALSLLLAAIGLYGVLAYDVGRRFNEFGIRLTLGASGLSIFCSVLRRGVVLVGAGLAAGIAAAYFATRLIRGLLFEIQPLDAASYAGAIALLIVVGLLACLLPAWHATRVDVMKALRCE